MDGMRMTSDSKLVETIVGEVKSKGLFDQFRRECLADVDTKPAYQNLRQRVENAVSNFLNQQEWKPDSNRNQMREKLRKNIIELGFLETGVERIVDQVVNPKISTVFLPKVEDIVYTYLGIEKPAPKPKIENIDSADYNGILTVKTDLLPTDLEAVSPDSDKSNHKSFDSVENALLKLNNSTSDLNESNEKIDDEESPPFEPLEGRPLSALIKEESNDSHLSGISGLTSQDSICSNSKIEDDKEILKEVKKEIHIEDEIELGIEKSDNADETVVTEKTVSEVVEAMESGNQDSQLSQVSSTSRLSIVTNDNSNDSDRNNMKMDISEEAQMPKFNESSDDSNEIKDRENKKPILTTFDIKQEEIKFDQTERTDIDKNNLPLEIKEEPLIHEDMIIHKSEPELIQKEENNFKQFASSLKNLDSINSSIDLNSISPSVASENLSSDVFAGPTSQTMSSVSQENSQDSFNDLIIDEKLEDDEEINKKNEDISTIDHNKEKCNDIAKMIEKLEDKAKNEDEKDNVEKEINVSGCLESKEVIDNTACSENKEEENYSNKINDKQKKSSKQEKHSNSSSSRSNHQKEKSDREVKKISPNSKVSLSSSSSSSSSTSSSFRSSKEYKNNDKDNKQKQNSKTGNEKTNISETNISPEKEKIALTENSNLTVDNSSSSNQLKIVEDDVQEIEISDLTNSPKEIKIEEGKQSKDATKSKSSKEREEKRKSHSSSSSTYHRSSSKDSYKKSSSGGGSSNSNSNKNDYSKNKKDKRDAHDSKYKSRKSSEKKRSDEDCKKSDHSKNYSDKNKDRKRKSSDQTEPSKSSSHKNKNPKISDDHSSSREKQIEKRRSTDRDSNDGSNCGPNASSSSSSSRNNKEETSSKSSSQSSSGSSKTSSVNSSASNSPRDNVNNLNDIPKEDVKPSSSNSTIITDITNPDLLVDKDSFLHQTPPVIVDQFLAGSEINLQMIVKQKLENETDPTLVQISELTNMHFNKRKPKIASNMAEARKLMKLRKKIDREQKKQMEKALVLAKEYISLNPDSINSGLPKINQGIELEFACVNHRKEAGPIISSPIKPDSAISPLPNLIQPSDSNTSFKPVLCDADEKYDLLYFPEENSFYSESISEKWWNKQKQETNLDSMKIIEKLCRNMQDEVIKIKPKSIPALMAEDDKNENKIKPDDNIGKVMKKEIKITLTKINGLHNHQCQDQQRDVETIVKAAEQQNEINSTTLDDPIRNHAITELSTKRKFNDGCNNNMKVSSKKTKIENSIGDMNGNDDSKQIPMPMDQKGPRIGQTKAPNDDDDDVSTVEPVNDDHTMGEIITANEKIERKATIARTKQPTTQSQRYSSDDLYKPRPMVGQRSRRRNLDSM